MLALRTAMEVEVIRAVELIEAVQDILACVRVDHIEEDGQAHAVSGVDEFLELFGRPVSRTSGEEIRDLISER